MMLQLLENISSLKKVGCIDKANPLKKKDKANPIFNAAILSSKFISSAVEQPRVVEVKNRSSYSSLGTAIHNSAIYILFG